MDVAPVEEKAALPKSCTIHTTEGDIVSQQYPALGYEFIATAVEIVPGHRTEDSRQLHPACAKR